MDKKYSIRGFFLNCTRYLSVCIVFHLLPCLLLGQAAQNSYAESWRRIDSLITKKGLTQSASKEVKNIYELAKKENNEVQVIKALLYEVELNENGEEATTMGGMHRLDNEVSGANGPAKSILQSIEAEWYWNYFQQHRWKLYDRTQTLDSGNNELSTWAINDFYKKISGLFQASLDNAKMLQQTRLELFDPILIKGNARFLRPTVFDLLAHRALGFFIHEAGYMATPTNAYEINNPKVFSDAPVFANYLFITRDSQSFEFKALQLFQKLLQFHLQDKRTDALIDVDIKRIEFMKNNAVLENKDALYQTALEALTAKFPDRIGSAQAYYLLAKFFVDKAGSYQAFTDTTNRFALNDAKKICERVILLKDSSEGRVNCWNLLKDIVRKDLHLRTEKVNVPDLPFRTLVTYRNVVQLHLRIIKLDLKQKEVLTGAPSESPNWIKLLQLPAYRIFSQLLPQTSDYLSHNAEIKIDPLPPGTYALLSMTNDSASLNNNLIAVQFFDVSNISYINYQKDYFVLNRESGQPLPRVIVQAWYRYFDERQSKWLERQGENLFTDQNGHFTISPPKANLNNKLRLEFSLGNDHLFLGDESDYGRFNSSEDEDDKQSDKKKYESDHLKTFFFTDRSIYRPGQVVNFKAITTTKDFITRQYKIVPQFKTRINLYDANGGKLDSLELTSNDFGSCNGKFHLPVNALNGEFKIEDDSSGNEQNFSVEEYKRPKFYVGFEPLTGNFKINDSIRITGLTMGFSGDKIANALVNFRVIRVPRFVYSRVNINSLKSNGTASEITNGSIRTGQDGKFHIQFKAIADMNLSKELNPIFDYRIMADVTDINGETRSGETLVSVGYRSLILKLNLHDEDETLSPENLAKLSVYTNNLSGQFVPSRVKITIYRLNPPDRLIRQRLWQQPDQFTMTRAEYLKYFPYDEYSNETMEESWAKISSAFETMDSTKENGSFTLQGANLKKGWYLIEAVTKDESGFEVKDIRYVQLYDSQNENPVNPRYNWDFQVSSIALPGSTAIQHVGSSARDLFVIQQVDNKNAVYKGVLDAQNPSLSYTYFTLNNEKKTFEFPVTESDRGGFGVMYTFVKNNRMYSSGRTIEVPWTNKELTIHYETFRNKDLPGSEEKWKIKISGFNTGKESAEMLTTMYDASLDQFKFQEWRHPNIWERYLRPSNWNGRNSFHIVQSQERYPKDSTLVTQNHIYDVIDLRLNAVSNGINRNMRSTGQIATFKGGEAAQRLIDPSALNEESNVLFKAESKKQQVIVQDIELEDVKIKEDNEDLGSDFGQVRKNFSETAFFIPDLRTDSSGSVEFSFTMPESLTTWKWMSFAHTKDLSFGYSQKYIVTQKNLMVQSGMPRFLREGDHPVLPVKIVNLGDSELTGQIALELFDPMTNQSVDGVFENMQANQYFTVSAGQSIAANFPIAVPNRYDRPINYRIHAKAIKRGGIPIPEGLGASDGEEAILPVMSTRQLVTETLPLSITGTQTKKFKIEKLLKSAESETLDQHRLTIELSGNPAWYAVQALPFLMEPRNDCIEQVFNRFFANALAFRIVNSSPRIQETLSLWKNSSDSNGLSNLQKNEELKSILLQETPWVMQAKSEAQQNRDVAFLLDSDRVKKELFSSLNLLLQKQRPNGAFAWFTGGPDDRYMTQYIMTGIGQLKKLGAWTPFLAEKMQMLVNAALTYLDTKIREDDLAIGPGVKPVIGNDQIQYLYMRSFYPDYVIPVEDAAAASKYRKLAQQNWLQQNAYMQGMIALALYRSGEPKEAKDIIASLRENAIFNEETGMFWNEIVEGYYWWQAPIETEALMIEAFGEIANDQKSVSALKTWLLRQKQTEYWMTTKATADACGAILLQGADWLSDESKINIKLGNTTIHQNDMDRQAGTCYFKKVFEAKDINPSMGNIEVSVNQSNSQPNQNPVWGAIYWQYFEDMDKISKSASPLKLTKKIYVEKNTGRGRIIEPLSENSSLRLGDKIKVRIELQADRNLEYVQMKDMRASCMEPLNVLSAYKWQGGLGYYESEKDASTNFFFARLPKGNYIFEYPLFVTQSGSFNCGLTTIQCMYAPEFSSHSESIHVNVENPSIQ